MRSEIVVLVFVVPFKTHHPWFGAEWRELEQGDTSFYNDTIIHIDLLTTQHATTQNSLH